MRRFDRSHIHVSQHPGIVVERGLEPVVAVDGDWQGQPHNAADRRAPVLGHARRLGWSLKLLSRG